MSLWTMPLLAVLIQTQALNIQVARVPVPNVCI